MFTHSDVPASLVLPSLKSTDTELAASCYPYCQLTLQWLSLAQRRVLSEGDHPHHIGFAS